MTKLEDSGLPVVYLDGSTDPFTGSQRGVALLGDILSREKKAAGIVNYVDSQLNAVLNVIDRNRPVSPKVYLEAGIEGPEKPGQTYGSSGIPKKYTSWGAVLHRLRVNNIAEGIASPMGSVSPEFILKSDPEVIVITGQNWNTSARAMRLGYNVQQQEAGRLLSDFSTRPGWSSLSAVKHKRMYSVFHNSAAVICFASIQALAKYIYPDHFKELDPEKNLKDFYRRFMPVTYSGTWMTAMQ